MKKILFCIGSFLLALLLPMSCYAGDVPETLLYDENAEVFFGEVTAIEDTQVAFLIKQNIKGENLIDEEVVFEDTIVADPRIGETYLCGSLEGANSLYIWDVTSMETKTLEIEQKDSMSVRMQEYLNTGRFEEIEQEEITQVQGSYEAEAITIIGGADGPTSVFLAGKIGKSNEMLSVLGIALILAILTIIVVLRKRKKKE